MDDATRSSAPTSGPERPDWIGPWKPCFMPDGTLLSFNRHYRLPNGRQQMAWVMADGVADNHNRPRPITSNPWTGRNAYVLAG